MEFTIYTLNDNGSGMEYYNKEETLKEISQMIDDCIENGGTYFSISVDTDASCFCCEEEDDEDYEPDDIDSDVGFDAYTGSYTYDV